MRLRRETGDFSIKYDSTNGYNSIPANLSAEDLVGVIYQPADGKYAVCIGAEKSTTTIALYFYVGGSQVQLDYTIATGAVAAHSS